MKSAADLVVPKTAEPVASCVRTWDDAELRFFVITRSRRSRDRFLNGSKFYLPVAAVKTGQVIWSGDTYDTPEAATAAAQEMCAQIPQRAKETP
jgi:hypothetical protein